MALIVVWGAGPLKRPAPAGGGFPRVENSASLPIP